MQTEPFPHYRLDRGNKDYIAEKIFTEKEPRSRVKLDTVKALEKKLTELPEFASEHYLRFEAVEQVERDFCLLYRGKQPAKPIQVYLEENQPSLEEKLTWILDLSYVLEEAETQGIDWDNLNINCLRVDSKGIQLLDPDMVDVLGQYRRDIQGIIPGENYIAPETLEGEEEDRKSRLFRIGVILYYLITGRSPFGDDEKTRIYDRVIAGSFVDPKYYNHQISGELNELVRDLLTEDPNQRLQDWQQLSGRLEAILGQGLLQAGLSEQQQRQQKSEKIIKRQRRKEKVQFTFKHHWKKMAAGVLLLVGIVYVFFSGQAPTYVKPEIEPDQVVSYFYESINEKDVIKLGETTDLDLRRLERMMSESYVMKKMQQVYGSFQDQENKEQAKRELFGVEELEVEQIGNGSSPEYKINYTFYINEEEGTRNYRMQDKMVLDKIDQRWQIVEIEGDVRDLIKGNFQDNREQEDYDEP
ncbi:MAG: protein kinase domain-containing protein [Bacillota bacterium]